jgi:hypothetical protein
VSKAEKLLEIVTTEPQHSHPMSMSDFKKFRTKYAGQFYFMRSGAQDGHFLIMHKNEKTEKGMNVRVGVYYPEKQTLLLHRDLPLV